MGREIYDIINDMAEVLNASQMHLKWAEIRYCAQMLCTVTKVHIIIMFVMTMY